MCSLSTVLLFENILGDNMEIVGGGQKEEGIIKSYPSSYQLCNYVTIYYYSINQSISRNIASNLTSLSPPYLLPIQSKILLKRNPIQSYTLTHSH